MINPFSHLGGGRQQQTSGAMRVVPNVRRASSSTEEDPRVSKLFRAMKGDPKLASIVQEFEERAQKADGGRTFGSNGLKVNSKLFALFTRQTLVVKLPKNRVSELVEAKLGEPFDPGHGRLMKEWLKVTSAKASWIELVREAHAFVGKGAGPKPRIGKKEASVGKVSVRPVTNDNWKDFMRLFKSKGAPHYCWCTPYRMRDARHLDNAERKHLMKSLVVEEVPIGVLAFEGDEPVGWCSIAPRETYVRLEKSRTMPRVTPSTTSTWSVLCFFVPRSRRKQGVTHALLGGAVAYARGHGAKVVEGYPFDTAGISSTHRGHSRVFAAAGFHQEGKRWARNT